MIGIEGQHRFHFSDDIGEPIELVIRGTQIKSQTFVLGVKFQSPLKRKRRLFKFLRLQVTQSQQQMRLRIPGFQADRPDQMQHRLIIARESVQQDSQVDATVVKGRIHIDIGPIRVDRPVDVVDLFIQPTQIIPNPKFGWMGLDDPFQIRNRAVMVFHLDVNKSPLDLHLHVLGTIRDHLIQNIQGSLVVFLLHQKPDKVLAEPVVAWRHRRHKLLVELNRFLKIPVGLIQLEQGLISRFKPFGLFDRLTVGFLGFRSLSLGLKGFPSVEISEMRLRRMVNALDEDRFSLRWSLEIEQQDPFVEVGLPTFRIHTDRFVIQP